MNLQAHRPLESLWTATAPPASPTPSLDASVTTDVLVVGAGYTGLSTALHLAESGTGVCVLEAHEPGWGASGRNGGQVNPTLKHDPEELVRRFGPEAAGNLIAAVDASADLVFDLIERHRIDCDPVRNGWIQAAYSEKAVAAMHARAAQWQSRGAQVAVLGRDDVAQRVGTDVFAGGWLDKRAGSLHPLGYARGLARAAQRAGARIHGGTEALSLAPHGSRWRAQTSTGAVVDADRVVVATNGYSGALWPGLAQSVLAANSFIVATSPLAGTAAQSVLPGGETVSTSQRLLLYFRKDATGRLLMGGRGHFADPTGPQDFKHIERSLSLLFPHLGPQRYDYRWAGRIAITRDFMPHVHEPAPGVTIALGYNGRGIAMATSMGYHLARLLTGDASRFPIPRSPVRAFPLHAWQRATIALGVAWYGLLDRFSR